MIDINELSVNFYNELVDKVGISDTQILAEHTLYSIKQENLSFPRIIHGVVGYSDNEYNYASDYEYRDDLDLLERQIEIIPRVVYRFSIFADKDSSSKIFNTINKIHRYYSNDYIKHLNGDIEVVSLSRIFQSMIEENDRAVVGWYFSIDFNTSDILISQTDYATSIDGINLNINN
jgi:hypothetical protein